MENEVLKKIKKFQYDRKLHEQDFNMEVATLNILEELLEVHGIRDTDDRDLSKRMYDEMCKLIVFTEKCQPDLCFRVTDHTIIDGFNDIQVYANGEPYKLGYDAIKCLDETAIEINSRKGEIVNGKFTKDKSAEAQALWHKADFSGCKL